MSHIERGRSRPDTDVLMRIAGVLGVSYERLARLAGYTRTPKGDILLPVEAEKLTDLQEIAAQPPVIIRALRGIIRELRTVYLTEGQEPDQSAEDSDAQRDSGHPPVNRDGSG